MWILNNKKFNRSTTKKKKKKQGLLIDVVDIVVVVPVDKLCSKDWGCGSYGSSCCWDWCKFRGGICPVTPVWI